MPLTELNPVEHGLLSLIKATRFPAVHLLGSPLALFAFFTLPILLF